MVPRLVIKIFINGTKQHNLSFKERFIYKLKTQDNSRT